MFYVYVLQDDNSRLYKGMTNDLSRRLAEHLRGETKTTKNMRHPHIIYTQAFATFAEAREMELYLKTATGRRFLKDKLRTHSSVG